MKNPAAQSLGRLGGQAKSAAKTSAVRENAKLGGWPKGKTRKPKHALRRSNDKLNHGGSTPTSTL